MENKCSKYESLFLFGEEEALKKHIAECPACRAEQEKMDKVSELIDEVKFHYYAKRKRKRPVLKAVCAFSLLLFSTLTFGIMANDSDLVDTLRYGETLSAEDLGFPVDSYGLLMVDDEF